MFAHHGPGRLVHVRDAVAGKPQRVDEQCSHAAAGVELHGSEAFRAGYPGAQDGAWDLQHPERRRIIVAEFVGQMASLDHECAGPASDILAVLLETDFGELRDRDEETFFPLVHEVPFAAPVEQAIRDIAGYRERTH